MPSVFNYDPDELASHAREIEDAATQFRSKHDASHERLSQSVQGLGSGQAAAALSARLDEWKSDTSRDHGEQIQHAQNHQTALASFLLQEEKNRIRNASAGPR